MFNYIQFNYIFVKGVPGIKKIGELTAFLAQYCLLFVNQCSESFHLQDHSIPRCDEELQFFNTNTSLSTNIFNYITCSINWSDPKEERVKC